MAYQIVSIMGRLQFSTYDTRPVRQGTTSAQCNSTGKKTCVGLSFVKVLGRLGTANSSAEECTAEGGEVIEVSTLFNDIWTFDLGCSHQGDGRCDNSSWQVLDPGATLGGCEYQREKQVCTHPTERYGHGAHVVNNEFLFIYGGYSTFCGDYCDDAWLFSLQGPHRWVQLAQSSPNPGKRWRYSSVLVGSSVFMFGGHRLWHGFSEDNTRDNEYQSDAQLPFGGYMDDLWELKLSSCLCSLSNRSCAETYGDCIAEWTERPRKKNCTSVSLAPDGTLIPGKPWSSRNDQVCTTAWPVKRAGHAMVAVGTDIYLFGGYKTFYPYPHTLARGSSVGVSSESNPGDFERYTPYPTYDYFTDDFWRYDTVNGYWHVVGSSADHDRWPSRRMEHSLIHAQDVLILFGGYGSNHFMNDVWYYDLKEKIWIEKATFVHARYPEECIPGGQVSAFPTLGTTVDGEYGRASGHFAITYGRNQRPGWDGCRHRIDGRTDVPDRLLWEQPLQRAHHAAVYSSMYEMMLVFGGHGYAQEEVKSLGITHGSHVKGDFWRYKLHECPQNCSDHGECRYGFCFCDSGYYGLDCSNVSCPGDYCWYDPATHLQVCEHCCSAPHVHYDGEPYLANIRKKQCDADTKGFNHGICDGFGNCLCQPPFTGLDCSIKGCVNNCSYHGYCSEEYPVSRCICNPGYTGTDCSIKLCLNNCSYPNGHCDLTTGVCTCEILYHPYNRTLPWRRYQGMDCSYIVPFASANAVTQSTLAFAFTILAILAR